MSKGRVSPSAEPLVLPHLVLQNRVVRSATANGMADERGYVTAPQVELYRRLTAGEIGLIVTGHCFICPEGIASPGQTGIHEPGCLPGLAEIASLAGGSLSKMAVQLNHAGAKAPFAHQPVGPAAICLRKDGKAARLLEAGEMKGIVEAFVQAALLGKQAGFAGVQVHLAHGYLLSQFLDPLYNTREDGYGRTAEGRFRLAGEVLEGIKAACGEAFPVFVKMNITTGGEDDAFEEDAAAYLNLLADCGVEAAELSGHIVRKRGNRDRLYFLERAARLRKKTSLPLMLVGGIRTLGEMEQVLAAGIQMVSLCRPFICEPDLVPRLLGGQEGARCVGCEQCFARTAEGVRNCVFHRPNE